MEAKKMVIHCGLFSLLSIPILGEIFFKLPVKDVMSCKCVCTEWRKLISEPIFSHYYSLYSSFTSLIYDTIPGRVSHLLEFSENGDRTCVPFPEQLPRLTLGSCNGFLCIKLQNTDPRIDIVCVTNPLMGDPIFLPQHETDENAAAQYNFGFCSSLNKFKVLRIPRECFRSSDAQGCEIFTVGVDRMWRRLPNSFWRRARHFDECVALNDAFHWLPNDNGLGFISTFHLTQEIAGQISLPPTMLPLSVHMTLTVLGNQLAIFDTFGPTQISIWKMGKYSVLDSWSRVVVLTSWFPTIIRSRPVCIIELKNGDMLLSYSSNLLVSCNIEQKTCSMIRDHPASGNHRIRRTFRFIFTLTPNFSRPAERITGEHIDPMNVQSE